MRVLMSALAKVDGAQCSSHIRNTVLVEVGVGVVCRSRLPCRWCGGRAAATTYVGHNRLRPYVVGVQYMILSFFADRKLRLISVVDPVTGGGVVCQVLNKLNKLKKKMGFFFLHLFLLLCSWVLIPISWVQTSTLINFYDLGPHLIWSFWVHGNVQAEPGGLGGLA